MMQRFIEANVAFCNDRITAERVPALFDVAWSWWADDVGAGIEADARLLAVMLTDGFGHPRDWLVRLIGEPEVRRIEDQAGAEFSAAWREYADDPVADRELEEVRND